MTHPKLVVVPKPIDTVPRSAPVATEHGALPDPGWAPIGRRLAAARSEHLATLERVRHVLDRRVPGSLWVTGEPDRATLAGAALIVTVGGDGTFLTAARHAVETPLVGVNSSPTTSVGHYCLATMDTFADVLERVLAYIQSGGADVSAPAPAKLTRIRAEIGNVVLPCEALNDVLFAHRSPVASTRYGLHIGAETTLQTSSGIWVATASGSSAAIHSAGGTLMAQDDRRLQWLVREPYVRGLGALSLAHGFTDEPIEILSRSDKNALFLDGQSEPHHVPFGTRARLYRSPDPLLAFIAP